MGGTIIRGPSAHKVRSHADTADFTLAEELRVSRDKEKVQTILQNRTRNDIFLACQVMVSDYPETLEFTLELGAMNQNKRLVRWAADRIQWAPWASDQLKRKAKDAVLHQAE